MNKLLDIKNLNDTKLHLDNITAVLSATREIMNLYGIENRKTIGKAILVADSWTTGDYLSNLNLKYVTFADVRGYINRFPNVSHPTLMEVYRA